MHALIYQLPFRRSAWLLLAFSALCLEIAAAFFQHGLDLAPCVMCVYERTAMLGVMVAGLLGAIAPSNIVLRLSSFGLWISSAAWGLYLSITHVGYQNNDDPFAGTCEFFANYPSWFKLDEWIPYLFEPSGYCDDIAWSFLGFSMPAWLIVCFGVYLIIAVLVFPLQWLKSK